MSCDPGPILIFQNQGGRLTDTTLNVGLDKAFGFWNSVNSGDFNGDGKLDLICGNLGVNSKYELYGNNGLVWHVGDLSGAGVQDVFESYYPIGSGKLFPIRNYGEVLAAIPFIQELYDGYSDYASTTTDKFLGEQLDQFNKMHITKFESVIYLNKGGTFEMIDLPVDAQLSPV